MKSGIVVSLNYAEGTGIIEAKGNQEYFFSIAECVENELPPLYSLVTFVRDSAFKSTPVASLIMRSQIGKRAA